MYVPLQLFIISDFFTGSSLCLKKVGRVEGGVGGWRFSRATLGLVIEPADATDAPLPRYVYKQAPLHSHIYFLYHTNFSSADKKSTFYVKTSDLNYASYFHFAQLPPFLAAAPHSYPFVYVLSFSILLLTKFRNININFSTAIYSSFCILTQLPK